MRYTDFKHDGLRVSRFGLGCMRFPTTKLKDGKSVIDEDAAIAMVRRAIDGGVNYIDTAYLYPGSEEVLGKALRDGYRERVILSTKQPTRLLTREDEQRPYFEEQLKRLGVDHIDVYFLHNMGVETYGKAVKCNGPRFIDSLKREGVITYAAASMHGTYEHFEKVLDMYDWDAMLLQYNYYDRFNQAGERGVKKVAERGIPLITMESMHGGMLAADVPQSVRDSFGWQPDMPDYERALMWLINQPEVTVILSGCSSIEQVEKNLEVFDRYDVGCLTQQQFDSYENARAAWKQIVKVGCTGCNYCMPCPNGVDIPGVFELYNMTARIADKGRAQPWLYRQMFIDSEHDASCCVGCGRCEKRCPQGIAIIEKLKELDAFFRE